MCEVMRCLMLLLHGTVLAVRITQPVWPGRAGPHVWGLLLYLQYNRSCCMDLPDFTAVVTFVLVWLHPIS